MHLDHRSHVTASGSSSLAADERVMLSHPRTRHDGPVATITCMPSHVIPPSVQTALAPQAARGPSSSSGDGSLSELLGALQALEPEPWAPPVPRLPAPLFAPPGLPAAGQPPSARLGIRLSPAASIVPPSAAEVKREPDGMASASGGSHRGRRHERWTAPDLAASPAGMAFCFY